MGNTKVRGNAKLALLVMSAVAVMAQGSAVRAEDAPAEVQKLERVEVTGSNIKRTTTEGPAPLEILSHEEIEKSGKSTVADVIHSLPSDNNGSVPGSFGNGFAHGAQGVSLRGLTVNSTLVLVNGRRMATYGLGDDGQRSFVDLNQIPLEVVDRVEVEKAGASAVYGSDAIAGVVNIILKKDFQGVAFNISGGESYLGDGAESRASATFGKGSLASDGYNIFLNIEGSKQNNISTQGRPGYIGTDNLTNYGFGDLRPGNPYDPASTPSNPTGNVLDLTQTAATGSNAYFALTGACPGGRDAQGFCRYDPKKGYTQIAPDSQRLNLFSRGTLRINDDTDAYYEASLFSTDIFSIGTPSGTRATQGNLVTNSVVSQSVSILPSSPTYASYVNRLIDPNNTSGLAGGPFISGDTLRLRLTTADVGPRAQDDKSTNTRVVFGLTGGKYGWDYDVAAGDVQSHLDSTLTGYLQYIPFRTAVRNGTYVPGADNSAILNTVAPSLQTKSKTEVRFLDGHVSTEFGQLPGGKVGFALGGEYRRESVDSPGVPGTISADIIGLGYAAAASTRNVSAVYSELSLPILKNLEVDAAARYDHYSDFGSTTNPQIGFKFTPVQQLAVRGTYARAFRAPSAYENGNSAAAGFVPGVQDPVLCPLEKSLNIAGTPDCALNIAAASVGNKAIQPEKADSWTLGFVLEPSENYSLTADYYRIIRKNEIIQIDPNAYFANPTSFTGVTVTRGDTPSSAAGQLPAGSPNPIVLVQAGYINANKTDTSGFDLDLAGRLKVADLGTFKGDLSLNHIIKFRRSFPDGSFIDYAGNAGPVQLSSGAGTPNWRAKLLLSWDKDPYGLAAIVSYRGPMTNTDGNQQTCDSLSYGSGVPGCYTASFTTIDLTGRYQIAKGWELSGGIRNLTNKEAPFDPQSYAVTNVNATYDASGLVGRFFTLGMRYKM